MEMLKQYLGDTQRLQLHNTKRESSACELDLIAYHHRAWYDSPLQAKEDRSYEQCRWCRGGSGSSS